MNLNLIKYELQTILSGKSGNSYDAIIQTIAHHLRTSPMAEEKHQNKSKETEKLIDFAKLEITPKSKPYDKNEIENATPMSDAQSRF